MSNKTSYAVIVSLDFFEPLGPYTFQSNDYQSRSFASFRNAWKLAMSYVAPGYTVTVVEF